MKILILGGDGMLGHQLFRQWCSRHDVYVTLRGESTMTSAFARLAASNAFPSVDVRSIDAVVSCISNLRPDAIVNAVGIVKQGLLAKDVLLNLEINALFPHRLARVAQVIGARVIHFSTDCVFSGRRGGYTENDSPDPEDLYGRTKLLGELAYPNCITLRTSIVGRELLRKTALLEWFLAQRGTVRGFTRAIYTGFTTIEFARIVERLLVDHPTAEGLWHVSSEPISKFDLLGLFRDHFGLDTQIAPDATFLCDRSLISDRFRSTFGYTPPAWTDMVAELAQDNGFYQ
jgi:dTDP-4-dehydrorhamnose reductase